MKSNVKCLSALLALCLMLSGWAALPALAGDYMVAVVTNPNEQRLHLRAEPKSGAQSLGLYYTGTVVTVYDQTNKDWWQVQIGSRTGYMLAKYLTPCGLQRGYDYAALQRVGDKRPIGTVNNPRATDRLNLRDRPSETAKGLGKYNNGTLVTIEGVFGDWYHVLVDDGDYKQSGFMMAKYVLASVEPVAGAAAPKPSGDTGVYAVVNNGNNVDRLNLRADPLEASASLGKFYSGTPVEVLAELKGWTKVRVNNTIGYMNNRYVVRDDLTQWVLAPDCCEVRTSGVTLRAAPNENAKAVLKQGNSFWAVEILGRAGTWVKVRVENQTGYLPINALGNFHREADWGAYQGRHFGIVVNPSLRDRLYLREQPTEKARAMGQYFSGTLVELIEEAAQNGWYHVRVSGMTGYMRAEYIERIIPGDISKG